MPAALMDQIDQVAAVRETSRSDVIQRLLREALRATTDAEITHRLDEHYSNSENADAQAQDARLSEAISIPIGDERW